MAVFVRPAPSCCRYIGSCLSARAGALPFRRWRAVAPTTSQHSAHVLEGHTCVITGASTGIGYGIAERFASLGASVIGIGRGFDRLQAAVAKLPVVSESQTHQAIPCDITARASVFDAFKSLDRVTVLVNAAGLNIDRILLRLNEDDMTTMINTNLLGTMWCCRAAASSMVRDRRPIPSQGLDYSIINLSSVTALRGNQGQSGYAATKAGLLGLTRSLAVEFASRHIRVNAISPGFISTDMTKDLDEQHVAKVQQNVPLGRLGSPSDIADAAQFLVTCRYITGQNIVVDGGMTARL